MDIWHLLGKFAHKYRHEKLLPFIVYLSVLLSSTSHLLSWKIIWQALIPKEQFRLVEKTCLPLLGTLQLAPD